MGKKNKYKESAKPEAAPHQPQQKDAGTSGAQTAGVTSTPTPSTSSAASGSQQQQGGWQKQDGNQQRPQSGQGWGGQQRGSQQQPGGHQQAQGQYRGPTQQSQSQGQFQRGSQQQPGGHQQAQGQYRGPTQQSQSQGQFQRGSQQQPGGHQQAQGQYRGPTQQSQSQGQFQRGSQQQPGGHQQAQGQYRGPSQQQGGNQSRPQGQQGQFQRAQGSASLPPLPAGTMKRGTLGKPGQVSVNYLDVNLDKMPAVAYHYDVKITPERPKKFYRHAFEQYRIEHLGGAIAAYDGRASCYSVVKLECSSQGHEVKVTDRHGRTLKYTLEIKETEDSEVDLNSLRSYMKDKIYDKPMRALQCLEVVLAAPCHNSAIRAGRSFFKRSDPGNACNLGDGYEALVGLYQTFVLGDRPFVNVDISHKSFPMAMSIIDYIERYQRQRIDKSTNLDYKRYDIESFLKGINIIYEPPACFGSAPRVFKVNGLSKVSASSQIFDLDGKKTTVAEYYKSREYNLKFPNLLCLHVGPPLKYIYLPIELCRIEDGQPLNRKDSANQVAAMIRYAATSTNERKAKIIHLLEYFKHNLDPTISRFGIRLDNDFIVVHTRTLNAPQVEYKNNSTSVRNGSWRMDRMQFLDPKPKPHKWAILYGKMQYNQVADFQEMVIRQSRIVNVCLDAKAEIRMYKDERDLDAHFQDFKRNQYDLVFVIIPNFGAFYDTVKQKAELQYGILTQCIKQITVERKLNTQCIGNVLLKVNSKLNGINHKLKDDPRTVIKNAMFLGADVTHPSPDQREIPSVVGVAASHDPYGASYNMQYRLQRSALEEIEDMESITLEHLRVYHQFRKCYPEHIVYYRDGVSDGQFPKIRNEELRGISAACCKMHIKPKICCVIVVKRHHTRFFPNGGPSQFNKFNNVDPGTVVDRTIVHPNEMQFFMVSHQSIQGTAKPTRYNVIENTGNLDIDLLQQLTYNLCHMFPRCNRAVSYPAPAYLAHLAAARGRVYLTGATKFRSPQEEYAKRLIVPEFMKRNPMYFV
ncbi:protein argonaute-2 isoform X3 [Drosophila obscura]|uniref:protein argonaute-2 isoform X2 n=1 Tax=Drosophila obscura TaxID=7282 RepID=UPI001BB1A3EE|nr:protein argonaute-2 isoform X2 [Drosophila obscura]XP_041449382.1 protein argonaute-2 isoform X3 [Drosophila obscura]